MSGELVWSAITARHHLQTKAETKGPVAGTFRINLGTQTQEAGYRRRNGCPQSANQRRTSRIDTA